MRVHRGVVVVVGPNMHWWVGCWGPAVRALQCITQCSTAQPQVADFGLARVLKDKSHIKTQTFGTVTHMPPELLARGTLSAASDVYAVGVLMWEIFTGEKVCGVFWGSVCTYARLRVCIPYVRWEVEGNVCPCGRSSRVRRCACVCCVCVCVCVCVWEGVSHMAVMTKKADTHTDVHIHACAGPG